MKRTVFIGVLAGVILLTLYFGILTLSQGLEHTIDQSARLWYLLLALTVGFGLQVALFDFIRRSFKQRRLATATVTASGSVSAGSMAACCAHHLSDFLPLFGLSGLAAFLADYQVFFIVIGVMANLIGITVMLEIIQRHDLSPRLSQIRLNMGKVKLGAMISAGLITLVSFVITVRV